jgi:electron transfer flavoprotein beta subunit
MAPLEVFVAVKQIPDPAGTFQPSSPLKMLNPPDRFALEEALNLKKSAGAQITAVTIGPPQARVVITECLAAGVDCGLHMVLPEGTNPSLAVAARLLAGEIKRREADIVLCGQASLDEASAGLPAFLAEGLNWPVLTRICKLELTEPMRTARVQRQLERGSRQILEADLPVVLTVSPLDNLPRYVSLDRLKHAQSLSVEGIPVDLASLDCQPALRQVEFGPPRQRPRRIPRPAASLGASARLNFLLAGGQAKQESTLFAGTPVEAVERIMRYLKDEGLLEF